MFEHGIFLFSSYVATIIATVAGFGSSTVLIPVAIFFMDLKAAVFFVACFHLFNNLFKVRLFFANIDFKLFWMFGVPSIIFAFLITCPRYIIVGSTVSWIIDSLSTFPDRTSKFKPSLNFWPV